MKTVAPSGLRPRLDTVAGHAPKGSRVADIGAGDGQLALRLAQDGASLVIATEWQAGAYLRLVRRLGGLPGFDCRRGDGLSCIGVGEVEVAVVAGMGEHTIGRILSSGLERAKELRRLLLQPMGPTAHLRRLLERLGLPLTGEDLAWEGGRFYQLLIVEPGCPGLPWDRERSPLGPWLSHRQDEGARAWRRELRALSERRLELTPADKRPPLACLLDQLGQLDAPQEGSGSP